MSVGTVKVPVRVVRVGADVMVGELVIVVSEEVNVGGGVEEAVVFVGLPLVTVIVTVVKQFGAQLAVLVVLGPFTVINVYVALLDVGLMSTLHGTTAKLPLSSQAPKPG
jgi:hypothetical protein